MMETLKLIGNVFVALLKWSWIIAIGLILILSAVAIFVLGAE